MSEISRAKQRKEKCKNAVEEAQYNLDEADRNEIDAIRRNASEKVLKQLSARVEKLAKVYKKKEELFHNASSILDELRVFEYDMEPESESEEE